MASRRAASNDPGSVGDKWIVGSVEWRRIADSRTAAPDLYPLTTNHYPLPTALFHWDNGLKLTKADLAIDFRRRQPRAFISHAHTDHIARHEYALCTPETAALYHHRLGRRPTLPMPYRKPIDWGGLRLTTFPAGHCLGSAMLMAEDGSQSLLYTGDFKLGQSATAEQAELPKADILVIESTYGDPNYRLPPQAEVLEQFVDLVRRTLADGATPVIQAYILGKSQEVTKLLTSEGIPVLQHRDIWAVSQVYESCGVSLGQYARFTGTAEPGWAVVVPPGRRSLREKGDWSNLPERPEGCCTQIGPVPFCSPERLGRQVRIAVTGWAADERMKYRLRVDHALPLSDHADYDELFEAVARVDPRVVYCTHGPESFVDRLRDAGYDAHPLGRPNQQRLF
jgi:putative mRNA 3-end processing factor